MPKLARFRDLFLPASIGLTLIVVTGWYYLAWLPSEHRYLDDRNFRLLTTLGEQISATINNFDKMMDNASDSGITEETLAQYLKIVAPNQLSSIEDGQDKQIIDGDYGDPPNITVRADEGTHFLYLAFQRQRDKTKAKTGVKTKIDYGVRTDLDKLIRNLLPPDYRSPFDVILVAQSDGTIIFQKSSPGLAVARVDGLIDESGAAKTGKPEAIDLKSLSQASRFLEITLANTRYRLYSQPLQLSFPLIVPGKKSSEDKVNRQPERWVLFGLVSDDAFRSESQSISYTDILWVSAATLLMLLAPPFLKLFLSAPAERLRARDVIVTGVFACVAAAAVTFILLDLYPWQECFNERAEDQMRNIAIDIDKNFANEKDAASAQLNEFAKEGELAVALREAQVLSKQLPQLTGDKGGCTPESACRTKILASDDPTKSPGRYPYLLLASWSDSKGYQRVKWTTKGQVTPFTNLDNPSSTYYSDIKRALEDLGALGTNPAPAKGIGSQYSPNTGENITVFWELLDTGDKLVSEKIDPKKVFCASLITRPISVIRPILPADYQFAIIRPDGKVIYHSDPTRNLREDFFAEVDQNSDVRSRVAMRSEGSLVTNYLGRGHRLFIHPMTANPDVSWTVIVLRDLRVDETMNLEVLSLATILFLLYALVVTIGSGLTLWMQRGQVGRSWLWPDSRKAATYRQLAIINGVLALLLLVIPEVSTRLAILFCAVSIPVGALVYNIVLLKREPASLSSIDAAEERNASRWQVGYTMTFATLLSVMAVLPCFSFFKVAWEFEQKLFIERSQLRLIDGVNARRQFVRSYYKGVQLGTHAGGLLAEQEEQEGPKFLYQGSFLKTEIRSEKEGENHSSVDCRLKGGGNLERYMDFLLGTITPLFNQIASDGRYLTEAAIETPEKTPGVWYMGWSLISCNGEEHLELKKKETGGRVWIVSSLWTPLHIPLGNWKWWLGTLAYMTALFWLVRFIFRRMFLFDLPEPDGGSPLTPVELGDFLTNLPRNLIVIGHGSSLPILNLLERKEVQVRNLYQMLNAPLQKATAVGSRSAEMSAPTGAVEDVAGKIVQDGRPVVFQSLDRGLDDPNISEKMLSVLEILLSRLDTTIAITSAIDPMVKASTEARNYWQVLLQSFVRRDLNSCPAWRAGESAVNLEAMVSEEASYDWLFSGRPSAQKLALVQLAHEKLINPNSRSIVRELMRERLVVRSNAMLSIWGTGFANFLESAVPDDCIKQWEEQGAGIHAAALRTSLLVAGTALVVFLLYTQGALVDTWAKYVTGLAAAIPAFLKMLDLVRRGGAAGSQVS